MNSPFTIECSSCKKETPTTVIRKEGVECIVCQYCGEEGTAENLVYFITCSKCNTKNRVLATANHAHCGVCSEKLPNKIPEYENLIKSGQIKVKRNHPQKEESEPKLFHFLSNLFFAIIAIIFSFFLLSNRFGDLKLFHESMMRLNYFEQYLIPNLALSVLLSGIILTVLYSFLKRFFEIIGYTLIFSLILFGLVWLIATIITPFIEDASISNKGILIVIGLGFLLGVITFGYEYFSISNKWAQIVFVTIFPCLLFFLHHKYTQTYTSNPFIMNIPSEYRANTQRESYTNTFIEKVKSYGFNQKPNYSEIIINYFQIHGYSHRPGDALYRSEGYTSFPEQPEYVLKHGIFSKRLVAKLLNIPFDQMENDCALNYEKMGEDYRRAYQIKEEDPYYFQRVYKELLEEVNTLIQNNQNQDPMDNLCNLHVGWCMWESYLISTGDISVAGGYGGDTYEFSPKSSNPLTFETGTYCGATQNAVLLWIRPEDYYIERIR